MRMVEVALALALRFQPSSAMAPPPSTGFIVYVRKDHDAILLSQTTAKSALPTN